MEKKKKILYVITKSNWGGAQRYVYDIVTNLPPKKFDVSVVFGGEGELAIKLKEAGIRTIALKRLQRNIGIINDIASFFSLIKIFSKEKPDIIHLNSSKAGGLGGLAGRLAGVKKIIFTAHGWAFNEERDAISKFLILCASWLTVALSHKTIAVSDYDRGQAERMLFLKNKIVRIHNGIGKIKFVAKRTARENLLGERAGALRKALWIGTIAELHKNKGLSYAIKAIALLKAKVRPSPSGEGRTFAFVVIGEGEERVALETLIRETHLEHEVFLVSKRENAATFLHAFDIFILPSIKEGLPYVILEAGVAKLPVVGSAVGGIPETIQDMKSGILVKSKQEEEIALALKFLVVNKDKRSEFGNILKEKVLQDFSLFQMVQGTVKLYEPAVSPIQPIPQHFF